MGIQHHNPEDADAQRRMLDEFLGIAQRQWPNKRISGDDDGESAFAIATDLPHRCIRIQFTKPMNWIGLDAPSAKKLAQMLLDKADELERETAKDAQAEIDFLKSLLPKGEG